MSAHWARDLVGRSHTPARNCWWLVREGWRRRWGEVLPIVAVGDPAPSAENYRAIRAAARQAHATRQPVPRDGDVVVMAGMGRLHVGMACETNGRLGVLESDHNAGVCWRPWREATAWAERVEVWGKPV